MSIYESLKARFRPEWRDRIETAVYHSMIGRAEGASAKAAETTTAARLDNRLTALGRLDKIRNILSRDVPLSPDTSLRA
ncbi:hypothetical protein [Rubrimonas cliftonensis]|uniref:Uncharacterized protein n=1 Tax=Rubrimonas cliftonensis TaxID=89524 RepID=A0A1H4F190_9RHOB|nr:hypothetical protein [Rubrimonas cliftonensis]SEA91034.1 hypothetical protein SAMN05444370_11764 [Rubrimonas cliftonensis]